MLLRSHGASRAKVCRCVCRGPARKNSEQPARKNRKGMGKAAAQKGPEAAVAALAGDENEAAAVDDEHTPIQSIKKQTSGHRVGSRDQGSKPALAHGRRGRYAGTLMVAMFQPFIRMNGWIAIISRPPFPCGLPCLGILHAQRTPCHFDPASRLSAWRAIAQSESKRDASHRQTGCSDRSASGRRTDGSLPPAGLKLPDGIELELTRTRPSARMAKIGASP